MTFSTSGIKFKLAYLFIAAAFLSSCSATNKLFISVENPPVVYTKPEIKDIGLINRAKTQGDNGLFEKVEQITTLEAFGIDEEATIEILEGFGSKMTAYTKFDRVKMLNYDDSDDLSISDFPKPLTWEEVDNYTATENIDLLVELSFLDTDSGVDYSSRYREVDVPIIGKKNILEHIASYDTRLRCGWRVYDPKSRLIIDEFVYVSSFSIIGEGINPVLALKEILEKRETLLTNCREIGNDYAIRFLPTITRVDRNYFVAGNAQFELAMRYAQAGEWDKAGEIWNALTTSSDPIIAGRAVYNSGIYQEILGNLDKALELIRKSYVIYEIDEALSYIRILENRIHNQALLTESKL